MILLKRCMDGTNHKSEKSLHHEKNILPASPAPNLSFIGEVDNSGVVPPDVSGTVGPNHIITAHNQDIKISTKTGTVISTVSLTAFWTPIGAQYCSDPKVVYDPLEGRYIMTCLANYLSPSPLLVVA